MEQKTDLSREFGLLPDHREQEFGSDPAAMDPKTDPSPEFTHPPDSEFGDAPKHQEFAHDAPSDASTKKMSRRERHRRTLLLQMAAVGLSAVVVTSSFGQDILGDDMLFTSPKHDSESHISQIVVEEIDEASKHDDDDSLYTTSYLIYGDGDSDPGPYADTARYDEHNNTLYLGAGPLDILRIDNMGDDFTIYLEDTCHVGLIECSGGPITITGNPGASLLVNQHDEYVYWWHGIILYGKGTNAYLTIDPGITVDVHGGDSAIAIDDTTTSNGIRFHESDTSVSGFVQRGAFPFQDGSFVNSGATDWTIVDEHGNMAEHVIFSSGPYNPGPDTPVSPGPGESTPPSQPIDPGTSDIPRLTVTTIDQTVYTLWLNGELLDGIPSVAPYDPSSNTLYIGDAPLLAIEAISMGSDFTIHVTQNVSVGSISSVGNIILSGENATLAVNEDMANLYGIHLDAAGGNCYLQVDPGISIMANGQEAGIAIANSWAAPGIVYDPSLTYIYEPVMTGNYGFPSREPRSGSTQDTTIIDEKDPFQGPSTHVYIEGSYIEPEPEPPVEEPLLNQYSDLYVTLPDSIQRIYIVENGQVTGNEQLVDGLSYDIHTNTLTLSDYTGGSIGANVMGDNFTIYLQGENRVGTITGSGNNSIASGSLTITGDRGAVLILNEDSREMAGIWLSADNTDTRLTIDGGINVTANGSYYAIQVSTSTAENAISIHEDLSVAGGTISASYTQGALEPESMTWLFYTDDGQFSKTVTLQTAQRTGVFVTLAPGDEPVNIFSQGQLEVGGVLISGISSDIAYKTLYLQNFTAHRIEICGMDAFYIHLSGTSHIGQICSDGSLHFAGDTYAALTVNEELLFENGIVIDANGSQASLSAQWGPDIQVYGHDAAAIILYDSTALSGISLGTEVLLSGHAAWGSSNDDGFNPQAGVRSWTVYENADADLPSRNVTISSNHEGGPSEDGRLTITTDSGSTVLFADRLPTAESTSLPGISYDHVTNTLNLSGATFQHIEAYHMGSGFTMNLSGENYGQSIISVGSPNSADGNLCISGDHFDDELPYGSLFLTSEVNPYGILLDGNGGSSVLQIDWVDTLSITAPESAIMVRNSSAETGIVVDEYMMNGQVAQQTSDAGTEWVVIDRSTEELLTTVSMYGGYGGGFSNVEHNGIIAFEPPSWDAQRWIYVDAFSPIYVDDPTYGYVETVEGVTYDEATNTLTLNNCEVSEIETVLMGDDFTIHLVGDSSVGGLVINASNVTFTGTGSLTIGSSYTGLRLEAQNRPHFIQIEHGVTMILRSSYSVIRIHASTAEQPLILADGVSFPGTLAAGYHNESRYDIAPDPSTGAANYSIITSKRSCDEFTEYVHSTDLRIVSN